MAIGELENLLAVDGELGQEAGKEAAFDNNLEDSKGSVVDDEIFDGAEFLRGEFFGALGADGELKELEAEIDDFL